MALPGFQFPLAQPQTEVVISGTPEADALSFAELQLDQATGDITIPPTILKGAAALAQRLRVRLQFFKGEWFLDTRQGMPYYEQVLVKNPDISLVQSLFRRAILSTPGVLSIAKLETTFDRASRTFTVDPLEIVITGGIIFRVQPEEFILQVPANVSEQ